MNPVVIKRFTHLCLVTYTLAETFDMDEEYTFRV
jgi:hypothetical protein